MQRTTINLEAEELAWLAHRAEVERVPQTEVVRRALQLYRKKADALETCSFEELARITSGMTQGEDGLVAQQRLRDEWGGL